MVFFNVKAGTFLEVIKFEECLIPELWYLKWRMYTETISPYQ